MRKFAVCKGSPFLDSSSDCCFMGLCLLMNIDFSFQLSKVNLFSRTPRTLCAVFDPKRFLQQPSLSREQGHMLGLAEAGEWGKRIGFWHLGNVYNGKWRRTDVAIKQINDRCFVGKPLEQEHGNQARYLHHLHVVAFYGVVLDGPDGSVATVRMYS
ncbi:hypothetical protein Vadar_007127 [Vaccinium darrowii]|uniref:Uncharacterized protein n=1 Tax=Vaccinium darrowii TaxID=229202 RepID=A0ACB7YJY4_9ERIC|nr:hypothetical protein Vadar_007127 [Vaccinium darrowii]